MYPVGPAATAAAESSRDCADAGNAISSATEPTGASTVAGVRRLSQSGTVSMAAWPDPKNLPFLSPPDSALRWIWRACAESEMRFVLQPRPRQQSLTACSYDLLDTLDDAQLRAVQRCIPEAGPEFSLWDGASPMHLTAMSDALEALLAKREAQAEQRSRWAHTLKACELPVVEDTAALQAAEDISQLRKRTRRKAAIHDLLQQPAFGALGRALSSCDRVATERRLNQLTQTHALAPIAQLLIGLLAHTQANLLKKSEAAPESTECQTGSASGTTGHEEQTSTVSRVALAGTETVLAEAECTASDTPTSSMGSAQLLNTAVTHTATPTLSTVSSSGLSGNEHDSHVETSRHGVRQMPTTEREPGVIVRQFCRHLPDHGNERIRRRAVLTALQNTRTTDLGIVVSHSNLQNRGLNAVQAERARARSLALVPETFIRLTDTLGALGTLTVGELLAQSDDGTDSPDGVRGISFRLTLICGLSARLHLLHQNRLAHGQSSNWSGSDQGLLHFNFLHTITGLGDLQDLAVPFQDAFCECLLDAGKHFDVRTPLATLWQGSGSIRDRTYERARLLLRKPSILGAALASESRFSSLISALSVNLLHARLIRTDPLRSQLAALIMVHFVEGLMAGLAPFKPVVQSK